MPTDGVLTRVYSKKACDLGITEQCAAQGIRKSVDESSSGATTANAKFEAQCDKGIMTSCGQLGFNLKKGYGCDPDPVKAKFFLDKACKGHVQQACEWLAETP